MGGDIMLTYFENMEMQGQLVTLLDYDNITAVITKVIDCHESVFECMIVSGNEKYKKGSVLNYKATNTNFRLRDIA
jgi:hypothetical protein